MVDILCDEGIPAVKWVDGNVGRFGKRRFQVYFCSICFGQYCDLVSDIGCGEAGVIYRAANRMNHGAVIVHIGILCDLADNQGIIRSHLDILLYFSETGIFFCVGFVFVFGNSEKFALFN